MSAYRSILTVAKREWRAFFDSPVAYVFLVIFLAMMGFFTFSVSRLYESGNADLRPFFFWHPWLYLILVPAIAMRLWSEEKRSGTIELLFTLPITPWQAILGKFIAAWGFLITALALTFPVVLTVFYLGNPDVGVIIAGYLGSALLAAAYLAVGMFTSACTRNQVISFILAVVVGLFLMLAGYPPVTDVLIRVVPLFVVEAVAGLSFMPHFEGMQRGVVDARDLLYFTSVVAVLIVATQVVLQGKHTAASGAGPHASPSHKLAAYRVNRGVSLLALLALVVLVNAAFSRVLWRIDLTEDRLYTISPGTRALLAELDRDVTLQFYFSRSLDEVPIPIRQFAQRVEELLGEYALRSGGRIEVESLDPRPDTEVEDWAQRFGLHATPVGAIGAPFYLGVVAISGTREAAIPVLSPHQEEELEYNLSRLIQEATRTHQPTVGIISPLPVLGQTEGPPGTSEEWMFVQELRRLHEVERLSLNTTEIPDHIDLLMVIQPTDTQPATLYAIDQFLMRGGRMIAFLDPWSVANEFLSGAQPQPHGGNVDPFNTLLQAWGFRLDPNQLVADRRFATTLANQHGRPVNNVVWLSLTREGMNRQDMSTAAMSELMLAGAGAFVGEPVEGITQTPLLKSSGASGTVATFMGSRRDDGGASLMQPAQGRQVIAMRLQGRFPSAYPDGPPPRPGAPKEEDAFTSSAHIALGERDAAVVLIADADILFDQFAVRQINIFGHTMFEPLNDNLPFVINITEQMSGNEHLIGLRARAAFSRPFERVRDLERAAQERWRQEEERLQQRMMEVEQSIQQMQFAQQDGAQQLILSAAQREELDRFQEELFETRMQLQEVRRNLRRDIEQLGIRIKAINVAGVPLLVGLLGTIKGLWRRRRAL